MLLEISSSGSEPNAFIQKQLDWLGSECKTCDLWKRAQRWLEAWPHSQPSGKGPNP